MITLQNNTIQLINGECLEEMFSLPKNTIDLILVDLPYGTTKNKWDVIIPFVDMWLAFEHVLKEEGRVVLTAAQPFASQLIMSNPSLFKYDLIWEKTLASGQLNVKKMPLRTHEYILIFYKKFNTYNEQKTEGIPYKISRKGDYSEGCYNGQKASIKNNTGYRHAKSVIKVPNPRIKGGHPTQKPLALMVYLINTFSNKGDLVLDCCMGSGTTGEACIATGRRFVGIELDTNYFNVAKDRLSQLYII